MKNNARRIPVQLEVGLGVGIGLVTALSLIGCNGKSAAEERTSAVSTSLAAASAITPTAIAKKVSRIVFVGKEHPCECTKARLEAGRVALEAALGTPPKVPVEQLKIDTESDKVEPYRLQKPAVTLPALYFVDANNSVVDLLQGEFSRDQVVAILTK